MAEKIQQNIELNPVLTQTCIELITRLNSVKLPHYKSVMGSFGKCFLFMQILHTIQRDMDIGLSYYWFKDGVVVDPELLMLATGGTIRFQWDNECKGCQIEKECPCKGNPHNNEYFEINKKIRATLKSSEVKLVKDEKEQPD